MGSVYPAATACQSSRIESDEASNRTAWGKSRRAMFLTIEPVEFWMPKARVKLPVF